MKKFIQIIVACALAYFVLCLFNVNLHNCQPGDVMDWWNLFNLVK